MRTKHLILTLLTSLLFATTACTKEEEEAALAFNINSTAITSSSSASYNLILKLLSELPKGGVDVNIRVIRDDTNQEVFSLKYSHTTTEKSVTISNLPQNQIYCTVTITATSTNNPSNKWEKTFKLFWK